MRNQRRWKMMMTAATLSMAVALQSPVWAAGTKADTKQETEAAKTEEAKAEEAKAEVAKTEEAKSAADESTEDKKAEDKKKSDSVFANMETVDMDGEEVDGSIFEENKLTLVNVWGSWCSPCVAEIPGLAQLSEDYKDKGVAIKGLVYEGEAGISDAARKTVEMVLEKSGAKYQQLLLSEEMLESEEISGLMAYPTTFFVDSEGNVLKMLEGSRDYDGWKQEIEDALKELPENETDEK